MYVARRSKRSLRNPILPYLCDGNKLPSQNKTTIAKILLKCRARSPHIAITHKTLVRLEQLRKKSVRYRPHFEEHLAGSLIVRSEQGRTAGHWKEGLVMHGHVLCSISFYTCETEFFTTGNRRGFWWESEHMDCRVDD